MLTDQLTSPPLPLSPWYIFFNSIFPPIHTPPLLSFIISPLFPLILSLKEDDGLRMRKSNMMSSQHAAMGIKKEEGLSIRSLALIVLLFVMGLIVGKLVL